MEVQISIDLADATPADATPADATPADATPADATPADVTPQLPIVLSEAMARAGCFKVQWYGGGGRFLKLTARNFVLGFMGMKLK